MLHSCLFFGGPEEYDRAVAAFLKAGLERGERCVLAAASPADTARGLREQGLDIELLEQRRDLLLLDSPGVFLSNGGFTAEAPLAFLADHLEEALADGRSGLCIAGDLTCVALSGEIGNRVVNYEMEINRFGDVPLAALCCYDRWRFGEGALRRVLCAHPTALVRGEARKNPFFVSPDDLRRAYTPPSFGIMLSRLDQ